MTKLMDKMYFKGLELKTKMGRLLKDEKGETNIIAIILILVIVIGLVIIFKGHIETMVKNIWLKINQDASSIYNPSTQPQ